MSGAPSIQSTSTLRVRFVAWSALMLLMLSTFAFYVVPRLQVDTDILALLPRTRDAAVDEALERLTQSMSQRQLFLIGSADVQIAREAAQRFTDVLVESSQFANVQLTVNTDIKAVAQAYGLYWPYLLADVDRARLQQPDTDVYNDALHAAYTPIGMMRPLSLAQDPLGLASNFLQQQIPALGNARLDGGLLIATANDRHYVLVMAETRGSVFASSVQDTLLPLVEAARARAESAGNDVQVVASGALQHAAAATRQAQFEINTFGTIEAIAVFLLLFFVFGRIRPLALGAIVLGLSIAAAMTVSHFLFGRVHVMALVFGASLIGVVIDYSMHFFADQFRQGAEWSPESAVAHVGPAILLGASITVLGYVGLILLPFPGLKQIATFSIVGIIVGCGSVLCLYPLLMSRRKKSLPTRGPRVAAILDRQLATWEWSPTRLVVCAMLGLLVAVGLARVHAQDDIHALQSSPPELIRSEQAVQAILGGGVETRFFLVQGTSEEDVLQREERLRAKLDELMAGAKLNSYLALTRSYPSLARQMENHEWLTRVYEKDGPYARLLKQFGFSASQIEQRLAAFANADTAMPLTTWLSSAASTAYRHLWLGKVSDRYATVVTLSGIKDLSSLRAISLDGVRFIDRPLEISEVMSRYRSVTTWLLVLSTLTAFAMLTWRFDWRDALRMVAPTVLGCLVTLAVFGWWGVEVNLFNIFALLLVLALGVDYGIFLRHGQTARNTAILSVTLSACTTLIGFGMLAFSGTPFIRSIGITLLFGIVCSWAFVMLSCMTGTSARTQTQTAN